MARKKRNPLRVTQVIGELFIVAGLALLGYIVWQPWHTTVVVQGEQRHISENLRSDWAAPTPEPGAGEAPEYDGTVPIVAQHGDNEDFAVLYVPAFAVGFANVMSEGVSPWGVLNVDEKGVGRYASTQPIGEYGNTAFAAHRSGAFTAPFRELDALRVGDPLFIETAEGWYTYRYRSSEYVFPDETDVLAPFPRLEGVPGEDRILTLTSCHPKNLGISERLIAYSVFESFQPHSHGIPGELLELNPNLQPEPSEA